MQTRLVCLLLFNYGGGQLDFEDEKPEDGESEDEDSGSDGDQFEDAMEKLAISDTPTVPVSP